MNTSSSIRSLVSRSSTAAACVGVVLVLAAPATARAMLPVSTSPEAGTVVYAPSVCDTPTPLSGWYAAPYPTTTASKPVSKAAAVDTSAVTLAFEQVIGTQYPSLPGSVVSEGQVTLFNDGSAIVETQVTSGVGVTLLTVSGTWTQTDSQSIEVVYFQSEMSTGVLGERSAARSLRSICRVTMSLTREADWPIYQGTVRYDYYLPGQDPMAPGAIPSKTISEPIQDAHPVVPTNTKIIVG